MTSTYRFFIITFIWMFAQLFCMGQAQAADQNKSFAQVWRISGSVTAVSGQPAQTRGLRSGDTVYVGEQLQAAANGEAVLRVEDGGYLAIRPGAQFRVQDFVANKGEDDHFSVQLVQGGLRLVTGWIGKLNPKGYRITTPSATIGVRGTDHEAYYLTEPLALAWLQKSGTYDRVLSGQTYLTTADGSVDIAPGQVGYVRALPVPKTRSLITLLMPVILEKVPEFFVPGQFDAELDQLSPPAAPAGTALSAGSRAPDAITTADPTALRQTPARLANGSCNASGVAQAWLAQLDGALVRKDAAGVLALFAVDAQILAVVADASGGTRTVNVGRDEFASSAVAALNALSDFSQRRLSVSAEPVDASNCAVVSVKSVVIEQGKQNGKPYRFETVEEYQLSQIQGQWQATKAVSRSPQR